VWAWSQTVGARHLEDVHSIEPKAAEALSYPKLSKERSLIYELMTRRGDYLHISCVFFSLLVCVLCLVTGCCLLLDAVL